MNILICDDEKNIVEGISNLLKQIIDVSDRIIPFVKSLDLENYLIENKNKYNILFMDINLKDINGINFIKENKFLLDNTKIIYITGYDEYIEDTFETDPIYILRKPLNLEKLKKALIKAKEEILRENKFLIIKINKEIVKLRVNDIIYIESKARNVNIHLDNEIITGYEKLSVLEEKLSNNFIRVHKSFLVNIKKIKKYKTKEVVLENGEVLNISRTYAKNSRNVILKYLESLS